MSRIGKNPIEIPEKVEVKVNGTQVTVKGPKGTLTETFHSDIIIELEDKAIAVKRPSELKLHKSLHGTVAARVRNMVTGVTAGFEKTLNIAGVGYRAALNGKTLNLSLGYSHTIDVPVPNELEAAVEDKGLTIKIRGIDKQKVGQFAAEIRSLREPEPYKGKGIRYSDEVIIRKAGKRAV
ncbi:MAG: 50S ribosomal protein L6 [Candidatus Muiribacteriota bacterium]|jgi:large subunit ribosomal protein L6